MTDFLTENSLYYQSSSFSSSYFFTNQNYKNYDFKNAIETSTNEALNDVDASFEDDSKGKTSYTRIVSASVMTSQMSAIASSDGGTAYSYQGVMQKFEIRIDVNGDERKYTATGTDKDGKEFSKEIDPYNVDPTDADFIEFAALCSYIRDTENLADETMKFVDNVAADDIFERMNYLSAFSTEVGKFEIAGLSNLAAEKLMPHINRLMEVLINSGIGNIEGARINVVPTGSSISSTGIISSLSLEYDVDLSESEPKDNKVQEKDLGMGFVLTPGMGHGMTATQLINEDIDDVIVRVNISNGLSYDVNLSEVDPRNATAIEMFAYCQYADENGTGIAGNHFGSWNALKSFMDPLGGLEFSSVEEAANKKLNWVQAISEADVSFKRESTGEVMEVQDVLKMLIETYSKLESKNEEDDWRGMSDEEWEKLLDRVDNDINAIIELIREEAEKAKETHQKEDELDEQVAEEI